MGYLVRQTGEFRDWWVGLRDGLAKLAIGRRIERAESGNLGDAKSVGDGVSEMRIKLGPGYRIYYTTRGREIIILLCGGDKSNQARDIERAKALVKEV